MLNRTKLIFCKARRLIPAKYIHFNQPQKLSENYFQKVFIGIYFPAWISSKGFSMTQQEQVKVLKLFTFRNYYTFSYLFPPTVSKVEAR